MIFSFRKKRELFTFIFVISKKNMNSKNSIMSIHFADLKHIFIYQTFTIFLFRSFFLEHFLYMTEEDFFIQVGKHVMVSDKFWPPVRVTVSFVRANGHIMMVLWCSGLYFRRRFFLSHLKWYNVDPSKYLYWLNSTYFKIYLD